MTHGGLNAMSPMPATSSSNSAARTTSSVAGPACAYCSGTGWELDEDGTARGCRADCLASRRPAPTSGTSTPARIDKGAERRDGVFLRNAATIVPEHVRWVERGLIPLGAVTLLVGVTSVGKSTIAYEKLARATRGDLPGDLRGKAVSVVVATTEDAVRSVVVPRLVAAGADTSRVEIVEARRGSVECGLDLAEDLDELAHRIAAVEARLVLLDPLVGHIPLGIDSHKDQHVRRILAPLRGLAEAHDLAIIAIVHLNKNPSLNVLARVSGSGAFVNAARSVIFAGPDPRERDSTAPSQSGVLLQAKNNLGPISPGREYRIETAVAEIGDETFATSRVVWGGPVDFDPRDVLAGSRDTGASSRLQEAAEFLVRTLAGGRVRQQEVLALGAHDGIAARTLRRALDPAGVESYREGFGPEGVQWWELGAQRATGEASEAQHGGQQSHAGQ